MMKKKFKKISFKYNDFKIINNFIGNFFMTKFLIFLKKINIETPSKIKKTVVNKISNITNSIVNSDFEKSRK